MSHQWLEAKYVSLLSNRLRNFKRKNQDNWNFSCPVCGDSKSNKHKARGYVYPLKGKLLYHCHNCNITMSVPKLVKYIDPTLYDEYIRERVMVDPQEKPKNDLTLFVEKMQPPKFAKDGPLKGLKKISSLAQDHAVKLYVQKRMIPSNFHYKLYIVKHFKKWVNTLVPNKFDEDSLTRDEPRLVIPFIDKDGELFGFQGRALLKNAKVRYITIMLDKTKPKLFGVDDVDVSKPIYVVEGPIDSMFLPNGLASAGGDIITDLPRIGADQDQFTIVYDNEPRNKDIVKNIEKAIEHGYKVCLWPESMQHKDVNDMVLGGYTQSKIVDIINNHTYKGLEAKLELATWKKI